MFENLKEDTKILFLIMGFGLIIRVVYVLTMTPNTIIFPDGIQYDEIAKDLLEGKGYPDGVDIYKSSRAPGYPTLLALLYMIFGTDIIWVKLIQSFLNVLTILPIYGLGLLIFNRSVAVTASIFMTIDPFFIFFGGLILSEILFMFFLSLSLFFLYFGIKNARYPALISGSMLMGLAILTRASLLLFPLFIVSWIMLDKRADVKKASTFCAFFVVTLCFTLVPWTIRNYYVYHSFVPITIGVGKTLSDANNPTADGGSDMSKIPALPSSLSSLERDRLYKEKAIQFILENPVKFIKLAGAKFKRFWNIIPNYEGYRSGKYILISLLSYVPILVFGVFGIVLSFLKQKKILFILLPIVYYTGLHMVFPGSIRYRVPIMPFFIIIAAYGFIEAIYYCRLRTRFTYISTD